MQNVLATIADRALTLRHHPFLNWLRDTSLPAKHRLTTWLPNAAPFVFGFMDLNAEVLRFPTVDAAQDPRKAAINAHLAEDAMHWPWYLHDLQQLGVDRVQPFSASLRQLWGPDTVAQRRAMYRLCALAAQADTPELRYVLIAALEAVAHQLFRTVLDVAREYEAETAATLLYLGPKHFEREPGHLTHQSDEADALLRDVEFDAATAARATQLAMAVCDVIEARWLEFFTVARAQPHSRITHTLASSTY